MRRIIFGFALAALLLSVVALPRGPSHAATGFHISGRNLLDANGHNFVMRGINHAHTWYPAQISAFASIKTTAANTVRVVLSSGARWTKNSAGDVADVIALCKANKLICVLEVHDTTGYGEQSGAISLAQAVAYWVELQSVLAGEEAYVIINIGNEPYGNVNAAGWVADTRNAIIAMRNAGIHQTLMVDAPNWGQDWQFIMRDNAASIFSSDPDRNTIFSIHMYGVFNTASKIQSYISTFVIRGLPLVIGEFGWYHTDGDPNEDAIMAQAQSNCIGYMGWSWSGNSGGVEYLDMVTNFDPDQRTSWGTRIITGANGLLQTSQVASVYGASPPQVSIAIVGGLVQLTWANVAGATAYDVYRSTEPYFSPATPYHAGVTSPWPDPDSAAVGNAAANYTYIIRAKGCTTGDSPRVGEFDFGLTPGE